MLEYSKNIIIEEDTNDNINLKLEIESDPDQSFKKTPRNKIYPK